MSKALAIGGVIGLTCAGAWVWGVRIVWRDLVRDAASRATAADGRHLWAVVASAVEYRNAHPGACPTLADLRPFADETAGVPWATRDTAGRPFTVRCRNGTVELRGAGADRILDTLDDPVAVVDAPRADRAGASTAAPAPERPR